MITNSNIYISILYSGLVVLRDAWSVAVVIMNAAVAHCMRHFALEHLLPGAVWYDIVRCSIV